MREGVERHQGLKRKGEMMTRRGERMTRGRRADDNRAEPSGSALFLSFILITLHVLSKEGPLLRKQ